MLGDTTESYFESVDNIEDLPKYCNYHKFFLIEELALEDYTALHYGKCRAIGKVFRSITDDYFLENIQITNLPEEYSLPEGTLKIQLLTSAHVHPTLEHGKFVEVLGEVVLIKPEETDTPCENTPITSRGLVEQIHHTTKPEDKGKLLQYYKEHYKPAVKLWYATHINRGGELISRNLEVLGNTNTGAGSIHILGNSPNSKKAMTQYFVESTSKEPQIFYFSQILEESVDHNSLLNQLQEDFERRQQDNWLKYWNEEGEQIILQTWNEKYKDYLKVEEAIANETDVTQEESKKDKNTVVVEDKEDLPSTSDNQTSHDEEYLHSWDELWQQHREEIYLEQYLLFTTIFYNYYLELKNSLEQILPLQGEIFEEVEEDAPYSTYECAQLSEELEQLKLLGLPTSFGGRPQNSSKKSKRQSKNLHFCDFFSESDMENASSESEMDDAIQAPEEEDASLYGVGNKVITKTKKKNRKLKNVPAFILEEKGLLKYWRKRFSLFSRFDEGIRLDRESWFSVTPEKVAKHLAERLRTSIIVDGFCGSGGNAIQFALTCDKVIAIDIDPVKLEMAKHNAKIYNVSHKIEFILGDFLQLASFGKLKADIVFLSPPWGGPKYKNKKDYDIEKYLLPVKASELVDLARFISPNVALFLPRNSNVKQIIRLAGAGKSCEIEHSYLDSRLVAITALYGEDILQKKSSGT